MRCRSPWTRILQKNKEMKYHQYRTDKLHQPMIGSIEMEVQNE